MVLATGFLSGLAPKAPGTFGSAACLLTWTLLQLACGPMNGQFAWLFFGCTTVVGWYATSCYLRQKRSAGFEGEDPQEVVIDEWAGLSLALLAAAPDSTLDLLLAFVLFRIFDIIKPPPVSNAERLPGAAGIMTDDLVAGSYAFLILKLLRIYVLPA